MKCTKACRAASGAVLLSNGHAHIHSFVPLISIHFIPFDRIQ